MTCKISDTETLAVMIDTANGKAVRDTVSIQAIRHMADVIRKRIPYPAGMKIKVYPGEIKQGYGHTKPKDCQIHIRQMTTSYTLVWDDDGECYVSDVSRTEQVTYLADLRSVPAGMTPEEVRNALGRRLCIDFAIPPEDEELVFI